MLYLVTGRPGNGKTLWVIARLMKQARDTGRPVYYNGIPLTELGQSQLGWFELADATTWYELGATSLVVVDEAQKYFRPRPRGAPVPKHFAEFETHRHGGIDVYLLTQDPMLIDSHVRKLVGKHVHVKRTFGTELATVTEWNERVATDPTKKAEYADSRGARWKYPKEVYDLYKSAEVHTHKADLPWRQIVAIAVGVLLFVAAFWYVWHSYMGKANADARPGSISRPGPGAGLPSPGESWSVGRHRGNPWAAEVQAPRVRGVPQTAPLYDALQEPVQQPTIAGCMRLDVGSVVSCECRTRQGSLIEMSTAQCVERMHKGWFDPTAKPVDVSELQRTRLDANDAANAMASASAPNASAASLGATPPSSVEVSASGPPTG